MADEDSQPEGLEALLQTLDPERQKILLFMLERDHLAALGAELVGPRAFSPEESDTARPPTLLGWTSPDWGDERLPETVPKDAVVRLASEGLAGLRLPPPGFQEDYREEAEDLLYKVGVLQPFVFFNRSRPASPALPAGDFGPRGEPKAAITVFNEMQNLVHELRHVGDMWQTRNADMDAEFSGKAGYDDPNVETLGLQREGWEDYVFYDQPKEVMLKERYKSIPGNFFHKPESGGSVAAVASGGVHDEPYARRMDHYNRERWNREKGLQDQPYNAYTSGVQKLGYIPNRYGVSGPSPSFTPWGERTRTPEERRDVFATPKATLRSSRKSLAKGDYKAIPSSEAAAHPAQGAALMELNRRKGRDPLEGMDQWLQRHGR